MAWSLGGIEAALKNKLEGANTKAPMMKDKYTEWDGVVIKFLFWGSLAHKDEATVAAAAPLDSSERLKISYAKP